MEQGTGNKMAKWDPEKLIADTVEEIMSKLPEVVRNQGARIAQLEAENAHLRTIDENTSDGYHTFKELYHHRMVLFAALCNGYPEKAWKARKHQDGSMFGEEWFIVGIGTPEGQYTYHYDEGWELFNVKELEFAPEWDGHQPADVERVLSLMGQHE